VLSVAAIFQPNLTTRSNSYNFVSVTCQYGVREPGAAAIDQPTRQERLAKAFNIENQMIRMNLLQGEQS
jgi:hypothetical protein